MINHWVKYNVHSDSYQILATNGTNESVQLPFNFQFTQSQSPTTSSSHLIHGNSNNIPFQSHQPSAHNLTPITYGQHCPSSYLPPQQSFMDSTTNTAPPPQQFNNINPWPQTFGDSNPCQYHFHHSSRIRQPSISVDHSTSSSLEENPYDHQPADTNSLPSTTCTDDITNKLPSSTTTTPSRSLTKEERQKLTNEAAELTRQLMRLYSVLDLDVMLLVCNLKDNGQIIERKANCPEMLIACQEIVDAMYDQSNENGIDSRTNPLKLALDIYQGKRSIFAKYEVANHTSINNHLKPIRTNETMEVSLHHSPNRTFHRRHESFPRGDIIRDIGCLYTSMYKKSFSNFSLSIKDASIAQVEDILRGYHRDGYKLSPGILAYLSSSFSERKDSKFLNLIEGDPELKPHHPLCWDVNNVPYYLKVVVYKTSDKRSSDEAKLRAKTLTAKRQKRKASITSKDREDFDANNYLNTVGHSVCSIVSSDSAEKDAIPTEHSLTTVSIDNTD